MKDEFPLHVSQEVADYIKRVRPFLEAHEEENGLFLGLLGRLEREAPESLPFMLSIEDNSATALAGLYMTLNLIVSRGPTQAASKIAKQLLKQKIDIPGVVGPAPVAESLAQEWSRLRGCESFLAMDQRIYALREVIWSKVIPGRMRVATAADFDLMVSWIHSFHHEALPHETFTMAQARENIEAKLPSGFVHIWEVNGKPVATASFSRPTKNGITVNAVYTPVENRKHGYASALVAQLSEEGLRRGKQFCTLYTDLGNPTSNSIYQKIGYKPVCDSRNYRFRYEGT